MLSFVALLYVNRNLGADGEGSLRKVNVAWSLDKLTA
jgi:hypothetical protein